MRLSILAVAAFTLIACASTQSASTKDKSAKPTLASNAGGPAAKGKYVCSYDEDTGSHMRNKVCRYIDDTAGSQRARQETQDNFRRWEMGPRQVGP